MRSFLQRLGQREALSHKSNDHTAGHGDLRRCLQWRQPQRAGDANPASSIARKGQEPKGLGVVVAGAGQPQHLLCACPALGKQLMLLRRWQQRLPGRVSPRDPEAVQPRSTWVSVYAAWTVCPGLLVSFSSGLPRSGDLTVNLQYILPFNRMCPLT